MKNTWLVISLLLVVILSNAQIINVNPDPDGEPWLAGELRPLTEEDMIFLEQIPELEIPLTYRNRDLPVSVDNSQQPYFRPIFSQEGGSCGQASGVGYIFTYEIDYLRDLAANITDNQYPTHFTWNFLNGGVGGGSWHFDGWKIIQANGCPNVTDYGGHYAAGGPSRWMSGYNEYYNGMSNRVLDIFSINVGDEDGLEILKNWFYDHLDGSDVGGLACFAAGVSGTFTMSYLPAGTPEAGKIVVTKWDAAVNHAMTFVGYNDSIRYDFNADGQYTNDIDINNDGKVNMKDWEIGGLKLANSWGNSFGNNGKAYMMYKLLAESLDKGGIWSNLVHIIKVREYYEPHIVIKATVEHTSRNKIKIVAGVSQDIASEEPECVMGYPLFNYQGGDWYMQGGYANEDKQLEFGLDITPLLSEIEPGEPAKFFLQVVEQDPDNAGTGQIVSYSIVDYTNGIEEVLCEEENIPLIENGTTMASIEKTVVFDKPSITTEQLPPATVNEPYSYQLNASGGSPPYEWNIIISYEEDDLVYNFPAIQDELLVPTNNDDGYAEKDLEFSFPFYGELYDHVVIITDGSIIFSDQFEYIRNEENLIANKAITPYGADLMVYPEQGDGIWYSGDENSATFRWKTSMWDQPQVDVDVAATIYPDGSIEFYYGNEITEGTGWAAGISNGDDQSYSIAEISNTYAIPDDHATQFLTPEYPYGMELSSEGVLSGTIDVADYSWDITFKVTDFNNIYSVKALTLSSLSVGVNNPDVGKFVTLDQNIPNPFTHETTIGFTLLENKNVEFLIYNITGQKIKTLISNEKMSAGSYKVKWDGTNDRGKSVSNGMYYYSIQTAETVISKKMMLLR